MAAPIPIPIDLTMAAAPLGWSGQLPDLMNLIEVSLSGLLDPTYLIGQTEGDMPSHDIGPWTDGFGWYFWDPITGQYQPSDQGAPVGTIAMWGGNGAPQNWLVCDSSEVSRATYSRLFQAVGETWGSGDGSTTFNLPPGACFYINAAGFVADERVPITSVDPNSTPPNQPLSQGVGAAGGLQNSGNLVATDLPPMQVTVRSAMQQWANALPPNLPGTPLPNPLPPGAGSFDAIQNEPVTDVNGVALGQAQVPFSIMPPFVTINYIIKYL